MNSKRNPSKRAGSKRKGLIAVAIAIALGTGGFAATAQAQGEAKGYNTEDFGFTMGPVKVAACKPRSTRKWPVTT